jgi:hypothetical protein
MWTEFQRLSFYIKNACFEENVSHDSSVGIVTGVRVERPRNLGSTPDICRFPTPPFPLPPDRFRSQSKFCVSSGFRREVNEICALLGCYSASSGNSLPTFRYNLSNTPFMGQDSGILGPRRWGRSVVPKRR